MNQPVSPLIQTCSLGQLSSFVEQTESLEQKHTAILMVAHNWSLFPMCACPSRHGQLCVYLSFLASPINRTGEGNPELHAQLSLTCEMVPRVCTDLWCCFNPCQFFCELSHCVQQSLFPCGHPVPPTLTFFWPLFYSDPRTLAGGSKVSHLRLNAPKSQNLWPWPVVSLCANHYLPQIEALLMRVEGCKSMSIIISH